MQKDSKGHRTVQATFQILRDDGTRMSPEERCDQQVEKEIRIINTTDENGYFTAEIPFYTGETRKKTFIALHRTFPHDPSKASAVIPLDTENQ